MANKHRLLLITTGGTIAGQVASDKQDASMKRTGQEMTGLLGNTIDYQNRKNDLDIDLEVEEVANVDSSNILPEHWKKLALRIQARYDDFESFVITHGTNTLGYTCAALSFALANPNKPIILTGSQVSAGLPGSDAFLNLENAIRVATWKPKDGPSIKGVLAVFASHIITGTRVKKDTEFDYDAFKSFNTGSVGRIGRIINLNETNLLRHNSYLTTSLAPAARSQADLICDPEFDMRIASLTEFPGMSPDLFKTLVEKNDIKAFILRSFGAGDPCERHLDAFRFLKSEKIPLVVTTQAPNGNSNFQVNEPGLILRKEKIAIPAYDMGMEAQTTKLAWLLAKKIKGEIGYPELCREMIHDIRGEINVMWEVG
jgi:L-asparaginase